MATELVEDVQEFLRASQAASRTESTVRKSAPRSTSRASEERAGLSRGEGVGMAWFVRHHPGATLHRQLFHGLGREAMYFTDWPLATIFPTGDAPGEAIERLERKVDDLSKQVAELRDALPIQPGGERPRPAPPVMSPAIFSQVAEITSLGPDGPELVEAIPVLVEVLGDRVLVSDEQVNMYGTGHTLHDALLDYRASLLDYVAWLRSNEATLAAHLKDHLVWLRLRLRSVD